MSDLNKLSLYYYDSCPFCRIVLQEIAFLQLDVDKRNIMREEKHYLDLVKGGGKQTVPCLLIEQGNQKQWMYESRDIIEYLRTLEKA